MSVVYHHGWLERSHAASWLENRGLRLGDGLFETLRVQSGRALFVPEHLARLHRGMAALGLELPQELSSHALPGLLRELVAQNALEAGAKLRVTVWRTGSEGSYRPSGQKVAFMIEGSALLMNAYTIGRDQRLVLSSDVRIHHWALSGHKTLSALPYVQSAREAERHGADDALLLTTDGHAAEVGRANLFVVKAGQIFTPPLSTGALDGVMRRVLMQAAAKRNLSIAEQNLSLADVIAAEALFTTNVVSGILPVRYLDVPGADGRSYDPAHPLIETAFRAIQARVKGELQQDLF